MTEYRNKFKENWKSVSKLMQECNIIGTQLVEDGKYKNGRNKYLFIMHYEKDGEVKREEREAMKLINKQYNTEYVVVKNPKPEICTY